MISVLQPGMLPLLSISAAGMDKSTDRLVLLIVQASEEGLKCSCSKYKFTSFSRMDELFDRFISVIVTEDRERIRL